MCARVVGITLCVHVLLIKPAALLFSYRGMHSISKVFCILVALKRTGLLRKGEFFGVQSLLEHVLLLCPGRLQRPQVLDLFLGGG